MVVKIEDPDALQNDINNDYIITKEMSDLAGGLGLRCGRLLSVANAMLIITKHINFCCAVQVEAEHTSGEQVEAEQ